MTVRGYRVLVVDDDELLRAMLEGWLTQAGYSVDVATNGAEGMEMLQARTPHVVVTDLSMPVMDGYEFCRRIREAADVPIMVFSGVTEQEGKRDSQRLGANEFAVKNIGMTEFLRRVRHLALNSKGTLLDAPSVLSAKAAVG